MLLDLDLSTTRKNHLFFTRRGLTVTGVIRDKKRWGGRDSRWHGRTETFTNSNVKDVIPNVVFTLSNDPWRVLGVRVRVVWKGSKRSRIVLHCDSIVIRNVTRLKFFNARLKPWLQSLVGMVWNVDLCCVVINFRRLSL